MKTAMAHQTPLAAAQADYNAVHREVNAIEEANAPLEEKFGLLVEARETARISGGDRNSEVMRDTDAAIARIHDDLMRGRQRLDVAKRRRDEAARRVSSEEEAITIARDNIVRQQARAARQREALEAARRVVAEKLTALDHEESMLMHFQSALRELTGDRHSASGDATIEGGVQDGN